MGSSACAVDDATDNKIRFRKVSIPVPSRKDVPPSNVESKSGDEFGVDVFEFHFCFTCTNAFRLINTDQRTPKALSCSQLLKIQTIQKNKL